MAVAPAALTNDVPDFVMDVVSDEVKPERSATPPPVLSSAGHIIQPRILPARYRDILPEPLTLSEAHPPEQSQPLPTVT